MVTKLSRKRTERRNKAGKTGSSALRELEGLLAYVHDGIIYSACGKFWFDEDEAARWEGWFTDFLTHDDKTPIELMPEWQKLVRRVFGWKEVATGLRKYREILMYLPRGCAKTTCAMGIALGLITMDGAVAAQVYLQASDASEASYMMETCKGFISRNPDLQPLYEYKKDEDDHLYIEHIESECTLRFYAGKPKAIGKRPRAAFIDEVQKQKNEDIISSYRTGMAKRVGTQPTNALLFLFGTAPEEEEESAASPLHKMLVKARAALANPEKYPRLYVLMRETTEEDDPHDPALWERVNIGWGISIDPDQFLTLYEDSKSDPEKWRIFCLYNLNKRMQASSAYMNLNRWDECMETFSIIDWIDSEYDYWGGLDFSVSDDMTAIGLIRPWWIQNTLKLKIDGVEKEVEVMTPHMQVLAYYFAPKLAINKSEQYQKWVQDGWLEECGEKVIDMAYVRMRYYQIISTINREPVETGYDPFHATETITKMSSGDADLGLPALEMVSVSQHKRQLNAPTRKIKDMVMEGTLQHNGNPILRFNLQNSRVVSDHQGNMMLSKTLGKNGNEVKRAKIDGIAAINNATRCWMDREPPQPSVYERRGLIAL